MAVLGIVYGDANAADAGKRWTALGVTWLDSTHIICCLEDIDDDSGNLNVVVGTVSGTSVSGWGSKTQVVASGVSQARIVALTSSLFVVCYNYTGTGADLYVRAGTVSGTTVTFSGAAVLIDSDVLGGFGITALAADSFAISFVDDTDDDAVVMVGTISGTTISMGSELEWKAGTFSGGGIISLDATHFVAMTTTTSVGTGVLCTVASGDSITEVDEDDFFADRAYYGQLTKLDSTKGVYAFRDEDDVNDRLTYVVFSYSGSTLSGGSSKDSGYETGYIDISVCPYDATHFFAEIIDVNDSDKGYVQELSVSGTTVTVEATIEMQAVVAGMAIASHDKKIAVLYTDASAWHPKVKIGYVPEAVASMNAAALGSNF